MGNSCISCYDQCLDGIEGDGTSVYSLLEMTCGADYMPTVEPESFIDMGSMLVMAFSLNLIVIVSHFVENKLLRCTTSENGCRQKLGMLASPQILDPLLTLTHAACFCISVIYYIKDVTRIRGIQHGDNNSDVTRHTCRFLSFSSLYLFKAIFTPATNFAILFGEIFNRRMEDTDKCHWMESVACTFSLIFLLMVAMFLLPFIVFSLPAILTYLPVVIVAIVYFIMAMLVPHVLQCFYDGDGEILSRVGSKMWGLVLTVVVAYICYFALFFSTYLYRGCGWIFTARHFFLKAVSIENWNISISWPFYMPVLPQWSFGISLALTPVSIVIKVLYI